MTAWLIERAAGHGPEWIALVDDPSGFEPLHFEWTADPSKAYRYKDRDGAVDALGQLRIDDRHEHLFHRSVGVRVTEHEWVGP